MGWTDTVALYNSFEQECKKQDVDEQQAKSLLAQLKIALTEYGFLAPKSASRVDEFTLARSTLENAALMYIHLGDTEAFERTIVQLKAYYFDLDDLSFEVQPSERQFPMLGLHLLNLLTQGRIGEFHTELELIPLEDHSNTYVALPVRLEQQLMEGNYAKILNGSHDVPMDEFNVFMDILTDTVRDEVAECSEKAYKSLSSKAAKELLMFSTDDQLNDYAAEREWDIDEMGVVTFGNNDDNNVNVSAELMVSKTVEYAIELEKIV